MVGRVVLTRPANLCTNIVRGLHHASRLCEQSSQPARITQGSASLASFALTRPGIVLHRFAQPLVGPSDWSNVRRTFQGGSANIHAGGWSVTPMWAELVMFQRHGLSNASSDHKLYGAYASGEATRTVKADLYWLSVNNASANFNGTSGHERRPTIGGRLWRRAQSGHRPSTHETLPGLDFDLEGRASRRCATAAIALAVDTNVKDGRMSSSPGPTSRSSIAISSACVHEVVRNARRAGHLCENRMTRPGENPVARNVPGCQCLVAFVTSAPPVHAGPVDTRDGRDDTMSGAIVLDGLPARQNCAVIVDNHEAPSCDLWIERVERHPR
jgi:hypothetical protein